MKKPRREIGFWEDFGQWMESEEGRESMDALDSVSDALEGASVDLSEKKIIWCDGQRLTIEQSAERIQAQSGLDKQAIVNHIIGWLQMGYVPEGLDDEQMEVFESHIEAWIEEYENTHAQPSRP